MLRSRKHKYAYIFFGENLIMAKHEIDIDLKLENQQVAMLDMHSFCNILNVIASNMQIIGKVCGKIDKVQNTLNACKEISGSFSSKEKTIENLENFPSFEKLVKGEMYNAAEGVELSENHQKYYKTAKESLNSIMNIANQRFDEFVERSKKKNDWKEAEPQEILKIQTDFMSTIAKNSKGKYGIVYSENEKKDTDYLIQYNIKNESKVRPDKIKIPLNLCDVIRDLTANARKYTPVGGKIKVDFLQKDNELYLQVSDNGRGIPENEIENVVKFGFRATNTKPHETMGAGFGLTKAYCITKEYKGKMWIESELGKGTSITIKIPV
jgi:signal transduction histidine kinase